MGAAGEIFALAARQLESRSVASHSGVAALLQRLDYAGETADDDDLLGNRVAILRAATAISGMFAVENPEAPGAKLFCGTAEPKLLGDQYALFAPVSVAGCGQEAGRAFERCVGEAVEYLSQLSLDDDPLRAADAPLAWAGDVAHFEQEEQISAVALASAEKIGLPARLCLRGTADTEPSMGTGCAAGRCWVEAATNGLWELIERDAVVAWWHEGHAPRRLPDAAERGAFQYLGTLRGDRQSRRTQLLDISIYPGLPAVAACSFDAGGGSFAAGFAAHLDIAEAARKAIRELVQMELGLLFVAAREAADPTQLNPYEMRQKQRSERMSPDHAALRAGPAGKDHPDTPDLAPEALLASTIERLGAASISAYGADLTRARFGIPVAKVVAPALWSVPDEAAWAARDPAANFPLF